MEDSLGTDCADRPISSLSTAEFMKVLNAQITTSVRNEVATAVAPLQVSQNAIISDLDITKAKITELVSDQAATSVKVNDLQHKILSFQQQLDGVLPATSAPRPTAASAPRPTPCSHPPSTSPSLAVGPSGPCSPQVSSDSDGEARAVDAIRQAKKVLGFSPIDIEDIAYLMKKHSIDDDQEAKKLAVIEFLNLEMKVPTTITNSLTIRRVFPPAKQTSGFKTLYAEFQDTSCTDLINQYVTNLRPGISVSIYVPHSLFPRFSTIRDIEHSYRNGDIKHKTRIKYGTSDFVLLVKPRNSLTPWTYVPLTKSLPPLQLSAFDGNPSSSPPPGRSRSSSPPPGRPRLSSKRSRQDSNDSESIRHNKPRIVSTDAIPDSDHTKESNGCIANPLHQTVHLTENISSDQINDITTKSSTPQTATNLNC